MTGLRANTAIAALLAGLGAALPAQAQQDAAEPATDQDDRAADRADPPADSREMTDSRARSVAPVTDSGPASGPPRSILPGPYLPADSIVVPNLIAPAAKGPESEAATGTDADGGRTGLSGPVGVDSLGALSPSAVGAWTTDDPPALPINMWRGTDPAILSALVPVLQVDPASPTLQSLARRLLLSPARPPVATAAAEPDRAGMADRFWPSTPGVEAAEPAPPEDATRRQESGETTTADGADDASPESPVTETGPETGTGAEPGSQQSADTSSPDDADDMTAASDADREATASPVAENANGEMLRLRLARLYAGGALDDFLALVGQSPDRTVDADIRRMQASALMLIGNYDAACRIAGDAVGASGSDVWQRAMVICAAFDGNRSQVYFRLELLAETGAVTPAFEAMALALLREIEGAPQPDAPAIPALPDRLDALDFTLARLSRTPVPAGLAAASAPAVLAAALDLPDYDPEDRLALIAVGLAHGMIDDTALATALAALPDDAPADENAGATADAATAEQGTPEESAGTADGESIAGADPGTAPATDPRIDGLKKLGRAYRTALDAQDPRAILDALDDAYAAARAVGHPVIAARMLAGPLGRVSPTQDLADRAHTAGRILVLSGQISTARRWFDMARRSAQAGSRAAEREMLALWPLLALAEEGEARDMAGIGELWWQAQAGDENATQKAATLAALLQAIAAEPPALLQQAALAADPATAATPSAALWRQLLLAIHGARTGETVLTALAGLRNGGVAGTADSYLTAVIAGLNRAGLTKEARALALERLAHTGF